MIWGDLHHEQSCPLSVFDSVGYLTGAGSDYAAFVHYLGISSIDMSYMYDRVWKNLTHCLWFTIIDICLMTIWVLYVGCRKTCEVTTLIYFRTYLLLPLLAAPLLGPHPSSNSFVLISTTHQGSLKTVDTEKHQSTELSTSGKVLKTSYVVVLSTIVVSRSTFGHNETHTNRLRM